MFASIFGPNLVNLVNRPTHKLGAYRRSCAYHYAQRMRTVYNFHAYTLRFRCLPRPWRARAWRARRLKKGRPPLAAWPETPYLPQAATLYK